MTNYNDGNWHGWNGDKCPVNHYSKVDAVWRRTDDSLNLLVNEMAGSLEFNANDHGHIIAFRVTKEHKEPREFWIVKVAVGMPEVHGHEPRYHDGINVIHVREVLD